MKQRFLLLVAGALVALPALAQQTGSITGKVTTGDGAVLPGVAVEARGELLPQPRTTNTFDNGSYQLPQLPPGDYTVSFTMSGMGTVTRPARVLLDQTTTLDVTMAPEALTEEIDVIAEATLLDPSSAEVKTAVAEDVIERLPVGQEYQDLLKLIPGVQISQDEVRGPSAGGSGQDNVYLFDGVNITLPLFGTLGSEPSSHDISQVSVVKGGARALDFNRSGGFTIDSVSKSGTNDWHVEASYQVQTASMTSDLKTGSSAQFERDRDWAVLNVGGPVWRERLLFYASYYRPTVSADNRSNFYGSVPDYENVRDELFGKLTWTPTANLLVHASYRDSDHEINADTFGTAGAVLATDAGSTSTGSDATLQIGILEGSWIVNERSFASFKYTDFASEGATRPDTLFDFPIRIDGSVRLDVANLDRQGRFTVPLSSTDPLVSPIIPGLIQRYGYEENGVRKGGGRVGGASQIDQNDFFRESAQVGYDYVLGKNVVHELHAGYQWNRDEEDLARFSNGWGAISVPSTPTTLNGQPVFFIARFQQQSLEGGGGSLVPVIHSEVESQSFEINDTIRWQDWSFNVGLMLSNDTFYGQGLREVSGNVSGFALAPGHKYEMYDIGWDEMVSPRLGATWAYDDRGTVYASAARYYPAASSLPRAASWDRNLRSERQAFFDQNGNFLGSQALAASSGKFFDDDLDPRSIDEYIVGTSRQVNSRWSGRAFARYRYATNFWEDTNNTARTTFNPPAGIPQELYIPNLATVRTEIGGSSYVIAELDGAFTKFYEVSLETERRTAKTFVRGSYVWSHYYGNFDQDNTTTGNDANIFIGSSFLADGVGRQVWDHRYGDLRGDRRHQLKLYGFYQLPWNASVGGLAFYQSGQPWEKWDYSIYPAALIGTDTDDTSRFAEPAGHRTTSAHYQLDVNYTHDFPFGGRYNVQLRLDLFNVFDKQTGYSIQNKVHVANFGQPRSFFEPRRLQAALRISF
jgi:hypothetical protein